MREVGISQFAIHNPHIAFLGCELCSHHSFERGADTRPVCAVPVDFSAVGTSEEFVVVAVGDGGNKGGDGRLDDGIEPPTAGHATRLASLQAERTDNEGKGLFIAQAARNEKRLDAPAADEPPFEHSGIAGEQEALLALGPADERAVGETRRAGGVVARRPQPARQTLKHVVAQEVNVFHDMSPWIF